MAELFEDFGVDRAPRGARLRRALTGSLLLHALFVASVLYVPQVQEMFHIASIFSGAEYVNEDYSKVPIGERVPIVKLSGRFQYPPGYPFKGVAPLVNAAVQPTPKPSPTPIKVKKPAVRPTPTPKPAPSVSPTPAVSPSPEVAQKETGGGANTNSQTDAEKAQADLNQTAAAAGVKLFPKINKKPFLDQLAKAKEMKDKGELDLSGTIEMTIEADREEDGSLSHVEIVSGETSNQALKEVAKEFIQALSASHLLVALEGARHLQLTLRADQQKIAVKALTAVETDQRATAMARVYNFALVAERLKKSGKIEEAVLKGTTVAASGNQVTVNFEITRATAGDLLSKQLATK